MDQDSVVLPQQDVWVRLAYSMAVVTSKVEFSARLLACGTYMCTVLETTRWLTCSSA